jgi:hypothetical protein
MTLGDSQALRKIVEGTHRLYEGLQGTSKNFERFSKTMFGYFLISLMTTIPKAIDLDPYMKNRLLERM